MDGRGSANEAPSASTSAVSVASTVTKICNILICTDSRGSGLDVLLRNERIIKSVGRYQAKARIEVKVLRGAKLERLINEANSHPLASTFDCSIIIGGICNLTEKHTEDNHNFLTYTNREKVQDISALVDNHIDKKLVIATITPASLEKYYIHKNGKKPYQENLIADQQKNLVEDCTTINNHIRSVNTNKNLPTLALAGLCFASTKKRIPKTNRFRILYKFNDQHLYDGVHLDRELKHRWSVSIIRFITQIATKLICEDSATDSQSDDPPSSGEPQPPKTESSQSEEDCFSGEESYNFKRRRTVTL